LVEGVRGGLKSVSVGVWVLCARAWLGEKIR
jgi:hypothetical protein